MAPRSVRDVRGNRTRGRLKAFFVVALIPAGCLLPAGVIDELDPDAGAGGSVASNGRGGRHGFGGDEAPPGGGGDGGATTGGNSGKASAGDGGVPGFGEGGAGASVSSDAGASPGGAGAGPSGGASAAGTGGLGGAGAVSASGSSGAPAGGASGAGSAGRSWGGASGSGGTAGAAGSAGMWSALSCDELREQTLAALDAAQPCPLDQEEQTCDGVTTVCGCPNNNTVWDTGSPEGQLYEAMLREYLARCPVTCTNVCYAPKYPWKCRGGRCVSG